MDLSFASAPPKPVAPCYIAHTALYNPSPLHRAALEQQGAGNVWALLEGRSMLASAL